MLIPCERCKRHFSMRESTCPFCRHGNAFARLGAAALSAGMLLAGCDAGGGAKKQEPPPPAQRTWGSLQGLVTGRDGTPLATAQVQITLSGNGPTYFMKSVQSDAAGHYDLELLEPGVYALLFNYYKDGKQGSDQRTVTVKAGDDAKLDVQLDIRDQEIAPPYGAPPARRRTV